MAGYKNIDELSAALPFRFSDISLLECALTHSSYVHERRGESVSYERLEFLGDAVLQILVSDILYERYPTFNEGALTDARKHLVCQNTLASISESLQLGAYVHLGHGEEVTGGREKRSILSDLFESLIAAIYLDSDKNLGTVKKFLLDCMGTRLDDCLAFRDGDYKTELQKLVEQDGLEKLSYDSHKDAQRGFYVARACLNSNIIGTGVGKRKQDAENEAAKQALILFGVYSEKSYK